MIPQFLQRTLSRCLSANQCLLNYRCLSQRLVSVSSQYKSHFSTVPEESTASSVSELHRVANDETISSRQIHPNPLKYNDQLNILPGQGGALIGKGAVNIRKIMTTTSCRVHVDNDRNLVVLSSDKEVHVANAKELVVAVLRTPGFSEYALVCEIPRSRKGRLIGKGGANIMKLSAQFGCHISVEDASEGSSKFKLLIRGNVIDCFQTRISAMGFLNLSHESLGVDEHCVSMAVPDSIVSALIGKSGETIFWLNRMTKCDLQFEKPSPEITGRTLSIRGVERDAEDARNIIETFVKLHKRHEESPPNL